MRGLRRFRRHTVVIHTKDDRSLRGVLVDAYSDCFALAHAQYLEEATAVDLDGRAVVPRENVAWLQVVES